MPVCIYNNAQGEDAKALERFREPSWNNPVVRFLDAEGKDLIPRQDGCYATALVAARTVEALRAAKSNVSPSLELLAAEANKARWRRAICEMHCFWEGQAKLGALTGVMEATPAFLGGVEVIELVYDPIVLSTESLVSEALKFDCARSLRFETEEEIAMAQRAKAPKVSKLKEKPKSAPASDQLHSLRRSPWRLVPMTPVQALRVNAALSRGSDPWEFLCRRQKAVYEAVKGRGVSGDADPKSDWKGDREALDSALRH